jgi:hypothetical protein
MDSAMVFEGMAKGGEKNRGKDPRGSIGTGRGVGRLK